MYHKFSVVRLANEIASLTQQRRLQSTHSWVLPLQHRYRYVDVPVIKYAAASQDVDLVMQQTNVRINIQ